MNTLTKKDIEIEQEKAQAIIESTEKGLRDVEKQKIALARIESRLWIQKYKAEGELRGYKKLVEFLSKDIPQDENSSL